MHSKKLLILMTLLLILKNHKISSFKTLQQYREAMKSVEGAPFTKTDTVVGKAIDFVSSDKTFMNLIAGEMWDFGSSAIDRIVEMKNKKPNYSASYFKNKAGTNPIVPFVPTETTPKLKKT